MGKITETVRVRASLFSALRGNVGGMGGGWCEVGPYSRIVVGVGGLNKVRQSNDALDKALMVRRVDVGENPARIGQDRRASRVAGIGLQVGLQVGLIWIEPEQVGHVVVGVTARGRR